MPSDRAVEPNEERLPVPKVMVSIQASEEAPTVESVMRRFGLDESEIDLSFGVVEVDPRQHVYTVLVAVDAADKIQSGGDWTAGGPFSNPRVQPFGPPESGVSHRGPRDADPDTD